MDRSRSRWEEGKLKYGWRGEMGERNEPREEREGRGEEHLNDRMANRIYMQAGGKGRELEGRVSE
jgi:hypothetical protein